MGCRKWFGFEKVIKLEEKTLKKIKRFSFIRLNEAEQNYSENASFRVIEDPASPSVQTRQNSKEFRLSLALLEIHNFEKTFKIDDLN